MLSIVVIVLISQSQLPVPPPSERQLRNICVISVALDKFGVSKETIVMINNPPGLYIAANRSAVVIPSGDPDQLYLAMKATGVNYLILEKNHTSLLDGLYSSPEETKMFEYLGTREDIRYFKIP